MQLSPMNHEIDGRKRQIARQCLTIWINKTTDIHIYWPLRQKTAKQSAYSMNSTETDYACTTIIYSLSLSSMSGWRGYLQCPPWIDAMSIYLKHVSLPLPDQNLAVADHPLPFSTRFASVVIAGVIFRTNESSWILPIASAVRLMVHWKVVCVLCRTEEEKLEWLKALEDTIRDSLRRRSSFNVFDRRLKTLPKVNVGETLLCCCCCCDSPTALLLSSVVQVWQERDDLRGVKEGVRRVFLQLAQNGMTSSRDVDILAACWRSFWQQTNWQTVGSSTNSRLHQNHSFTLL